MAHDAAGNVFVSSWGRVRRVDARTGLMSTLTGVRGLAAADPGQFDPQALAVSPAGDVYTLRLGTLEEFAHDGRLLTLLGPGSALPDRLASDDVAVSPSGDVFLNDSSWYPRIVKLSSKGVLTTVAGGRAEGVSGGHGGDGGPASAASLNGAMSLRWAPDGALVFLDGGRVRRIGPDGIITTIAGGGSSQCDGAPAAAADLTQASGLAFDTAGRMLITNPHLS